MQEGKGKGSFAALTVPLPTSPKCRAIFADAVKRY